MKAYLRRKPRHFIIFSILMLVCFLRTGLFERMLQHVYLLPLTSEDCWLLGCMVFLMVFLYLTAVGYRFDEDGIAKKYPLLPEKYYPKEKMQGYILRSGISSVWIIKMTDGKILVLPGYIPGVESATLYFLAHTNLPKLPG